MSADAAVLKPPTDVVLDALATGKPIRQEFDGGRLHIDRPLPFLCLHIGDADEHPVARELAASHASYLLARNVEDAVRLIKPIAAAMKRQFGTFGVLDVDELQRDRLLSQDAPFLQPFEITLSATGELSCKRGARAFVASVEAFKSRFRTPHARRLLSRSHGKSWT
ncbi:hypothetical protein IB238_04055 [Rhizobium sp. ARZ01]|uniref:hypothetical protein n=1 Tax=Rhizobium sp. ARZ01 TaxID=2769313 RepID=UPI001784971F|nr:hypothetical protein [Rhizobium sp. ARZ01]MBD9371814.1 hypothetical protein [Rhizobium sp. ARZ01]